MNSNPINKQHRYLNLKLKTALTIFWLFGTIILFSQTLTNISVLQESYFESSFFNKSMLIDATGNNKLIACTSCSEKAEVGKWQAALEYFRSNPKEVSSLVSTQIKLKEIDILNIESQSNEIQAAAYVILAQQNENSLKMYFDKRKITDPIFKTAIEHTIQNIKSLVKKLTPPTVLITATGNIRNIASNISEKQPGAVGTGNLGASFSTSNSIVSAQIAVAGVIDTIEEIFGNSILSPMNAQFLKAGTLEWYTRFEDKSWLHLYGNLASQTWEIDSTTTLYKKASILGLGVLYHCRLFDGVIGNTEISLDVEAGISGRFIGGNVRHLLENHDDSIKYLNVFPTTKSFFRGLEAGFSINFGDIIGAMQVYYYTQPKNKPIEDLTGLQLSVGLSVRGDLLKAILANKE